MGVTHLQWPVALATGGCLFARFHYLVWHPTWKSVRRENILRLPGENEHFDFVRPQFPR